MNFQPELATSSIKIFAFLSIFLVGILILVYLIKNTIRKNGETSNRKLIRVIESTYIGIKKTISAVEVPGAILIVGVSNDNIVLLDKVMDKELLDVYRKSEPGKIGRSFAGYLNTALKRNVVSLDK